MIELDLGRTLLVGLVATLGDLEPNDGDPFRPLEVVAVTAPTPLLSIHRIE